MTPKERLAEAQKRAALARTEADRAGAIVRAVEKEVSDAAAEVKRERDAGLLAILTPAIIDAIAPEHDRTSCGDDRRCEDCARCVLLEAAHCGWIDASWRFTVTR